MQQSHVEGKIFVDNLNFGGPAEQLGIDFDWEIVELDVAADRAPKGVFYIPAVLLLLMIVGAHKPDMADKLLGPNSARIARLSPVSTLVFRMQRAELSLN